MKIRNSQLPLLLLGLITLGIGLPVQADEPLPVHGVVVEGATGTSSPSLFRGTVDDVSAGGDSLLIDDARFGVSQIIRLNGNPVTRDRLSTAVSPGQAVVFQLGQSPETAAVIVSIDTNPR